MGAARRDPGQVGVRPGQRARAGAVGIRRALGQQLRGHRSRGRALARAARAVEQVGVRGRPPGEQRGREHGARVGMSIELCEHALRC